MVATFEVCPDAELCSVVSKQNGEDPIGSAPECDRYLIVEVAPPWGKNVLQCDNFPKGLMTVLQQIAQHSTRGRCLAIAPEPGYSQPGYTRILSYHRPAERFATYHKDEFLVPHEQVVPLVSALRSTPEAIAPFEPYRQSGNTRDLLVCTHDELDICCGKFGQPVYEHLQQTYAKPEELRVWRVSHIGNHRLAPTLVEFPEGRYWGHLELDRLNQIVERNGSFSEVRSCYRGWAGLPSLVQIAEREVLTQQGWQWCHYLKSGQVLETNEDKTWAQVQLDYIDPENNSPGRYEAVVEVNDTVTTLCNSGAGDYREVKRYRVSEFVSGL